MPLIIAHLVPILDCVDVPKYVFSLGKSSQFQEKSAFLHETILFCIENRAQWPEKSSPLLKKIACLLEKSTYPSKIIFHLIFQLPQNLSLTSNSHH